MSCAAKRASSVPSGNPEARPAPDLSLPRGGGSPREAFVLLPGLNLHPHRLGPLAGLLNEAGLATVAPALTGYAAPADPALRRVRMEHWLADVDAAWALAAARLPGAAPSLLGFSMGGLLGLVWALERGVPLRRAVLISPALRLSRSGRVFLGVLGALLPRALLLPSGSPRAYRFHSSTSVAAYRSLAGLQRRLRPHLQAWLAGNGAQPPPLLIACSARDELVDPQPLRALARACPERVTYLPLSHAPRRGYLHHLGVDPATLGEAEWQRLAATLADWLRRTAGPDPGAGALREAAR
jgi:alpha-beta hydrolase superfamily lysophospholipase